LICCRAYALRTRLGRWVNEGLVAHWKVQSWRLRAHCAHARASRPDCHARCTVWRGVVAPHGWNDVKTVPGCCALHSCFLVTRPPSFVLHDANPQHCTQRLVLCLDGGFLHRTQTPFISHECSTLLLTVQPSQVHAFTCFQSNRLTSPMCVALLRTTVGLHVSTVECSRCRLCEKFFGKATGRRSQ
jgi:hypothetical protein